MKAFIVKYAMTDGIIEKDAELVGDDMIMVKGSGGSFDTYYQGKEWYKNLEDAKVMANRLKDARIKSLEKSLAKAKKVNF